MPINRDNDVIMSVTSNFAISHFLWVGLRLASGLGLNLGLRVRVRVTGNDQMENSEIENHR